MRLEQFDYELPPDRIAQTPADERDASRLLVLDRRTGAIVHRRFANVVELLDEGDLLVLNDTRVVPARLVGRKSSGGRVELLLLEREPGSAGIWRCLCKASRSPAVGGRLEFDEGLAGEIAGRDREEWRVRLSLPAGGNVERTLERIGRLPLPPYIRRPEGVSEPFDLERYQTVYARQPGAVAAPTAGLHFTSELLERLERRGVVVQTLTLHVGPGTFQPVRSENVEQHSLAAERYDLPEEVARSVADARSRGTRVVAVGTTVVRVLESCADDAGGVRPGGGECDLFVYPGYEFRVVDALITNFHLPRSTLLMLVSAFAGRERVLAAYAEALQGAYRFFSYGDAMLVL